MKSIFKISAAFFLVGSLIVSCQSDKGNSANTSNEETVVTEGHNHDGHDHDGHDHSSHDHSGHDHAGHNHDNNSNDDAGTTNAKSTNSPTYTGDRNNDQLEMGKGMVSSEEWAKKKAASTQGRQETNPVQLGSKSVKSKLPSTCQLITPDKIGKIVGVDSDQITIKDGSGRSNPHSRSCFFRWEHRGVPNSGVMIQVQDNPLPDEFPDWAKYYIQAKVNQGEQMPDGSASYKYKPMDGLGDAGAYNYELNRYIWRIGSDYIFMIAFNLYASEEQQVKWAKEIGNEVMKKF